MNWIIGKWLIQTVTEVAGKFIPTAKARLAFKEKMMEIAYQLQDKYYEVIVKLQSQSSGSKIIDGFKHTVRPIIALGVFFVWFYSKFSNLILTAEDMYLVYGVFSFYFVSRGIEKIKGKS